MNITQLRYFVSVAQLENMTKAARLLHLTQSSLSKNISMLEEELGMPLFDRGSRRITLNQQGRRFLEYSSMVLLELQFALDDMAVISRGSGSKIRVGLSGANRQIMDCLHDFLKACPDAQLDINCNIERLDKLDINDYDMIVYPQNIRYGKFNGYSLGEVRYLLAINKNDPLAARSSVLPEDLAHHDCIFLRQDNYVEYPYRLCIDLNIPLKAQMFTDSPDYHCRAIADNLVAGFVPESDAAAYEAEENIRLLAIDDPRFSREMMICFRRDKHLNEHSRRFRDHVINYLHLR